MIFGVPRWNVALIVMLLAGMFGYATYFDTSTPEKTVEKFYQCFDAGDYDRAVEYMSVNWAYSILFPKFNNTPPAELIKKRTDVRREMAKALAENVPAGDTEKVQVSALPKLTRLGDKTALVVYDYRIPKSKFTGKQVALLVKETGRWRLFEVSDVTGYELGFISQIDMKQMDQRVENFFKTSK